MLEIKNVHKTFNKGTINEKKALNGVNLHLDPGDFVTIIGGNGAGKSTTLNMVAGVYPIDQGTIILDGKDLPEYKRAYMLGRVFQDPMMGTAAGMQIEENMAMANRRGKKRGLSWGITKKEKENVVDKLFSDDLKSFLKIVCDNDDIDCFDEAVEYYDELKRKTDKIIKAEFDYVTMPKDEQLERIKQYLMKQYQADEVDLTLKEDKDLIGGFMLKVGDHVYDNSLSGKMRKLQQKLTWR